MVSGDPNISVILPVLNESDNIAKTLTNIKNIANLEVIVVDGGSQDETISIAKSLGMKVLSAAAGRANQMNAGAKVATGEILVFLHADTLLPNDFDLMVTQALKNDKIVAGAFELKIDAKTPLLRIVEKMVNWRSHIFSLPYGDQAIFLRAKTFHKIGGFPEIPIMEDFELIRRLKQLGKITIIPIAVITSARRWQKLGVIKTTLINQLIIMSYLLGMSPTKIANWYRQGKLIPRFSKLIK